MCVCSVCIRVQAGSHAVCSICLCTCTWGCMHVFYVTVRSWCWMTYLSFSAPSPSSSSCEIRSFTETICLDYLVVNTIDPLDLVSPTLRCAVFSFFHGCMGSNFNNLHFTQSVKFLLYRLSRTPSPCFILKKKKLNRSSYLHNHVISFNLNSDVLVWAVEQAVGILVACWVFA